MPRSLRLIAAAVAAPAIALGAAGIATAATPGIVAEYPAGTGAINSSGIGAAPNGDVYGTFTDLNAVVPFTTAGPGAQVSVAAGGRLVSSIAPGPDGAMWMTFNFTAAMGRLDTATGITTQFPGLTSAGWSSAAGPDGRQWVTQSGGQIGAITPAGAVSNYPIPTASSAPIGITPGRDGRMWFTETGGNKIGAITTAGAITDYTLPAGGAQPQYIASGADGNLWFAEAGGNKIGRITTSGVITEFPVPTANAMPHGIAAGADGNLWFTEPMPGKVASITTAGAITEYSAGITPNSYPSIITAGPGGLMWFSNENSASVGSITTGNVAPPPAPAPAPSVAPTGPTNVVTPVAKNLRTATKNGRTTITFTLRYAASGNYSFRLETKAGKVLPMLAGSDIAGVAVKKSTTKAVAVKNAKAGKVVKVKVIMKGKPAKGTALRAIIAGKKGSRTTETIPV